MSVGLGSPAEGFSVKVKLTSDSFQGISGGLFACVKEVLREQTRGSAPLQVPADSSGGKRRYLGRTGHADGKYHEGEARAGWE